ncbi:sugar transferase [Patescibacteria group bacterium]|nr:sugar transferase [Patescibacteria group bacterium]MBU1703086.1 sugar transferase [Patescibacteria group bacterium]MBU1953970.1 sugar transferase [Patescibacteria group bacterium]
MIWKVPDFEQLKKQDFSQLLSPPGQQKLPGERRFYRFTKRTADIILSALALTIILPVLAALAIIVRIDSRGKAVFAHKRVGKDGKIFTMYKFRTMRNDVNGQQHAPTAPGDERVTATGKFLRRTSLDELPQLVNIIKGDMSLVGPRPEMPFIVEKYTELQRARLLVKPGLTGLWQLAGRKDLPLHENVEFDLYYILHQSLLLDLIILLKTFTVVFSGKGAY